MASKMTPKLQSHSGMSPGGTWSKTLYKCAEVKQDEPTPSNPINNHKQLAMDGLKK